MVILHQMNPKRDVSVALFDHESTLNQPAQRAADENVIRNMTHETSGLPKKKAMIIFIIWISHGVHRLRFA